MSKLIETMSELKEFAEKNVLPEQRVEMFRIMGRIVDAATEDLKAINDNK